MARRYSLNNQSNPSPTSASPSSPAPAGKGKGVSLPSGTSPNLLLGLSGGWLLARMLLFGGALLPLEIIAILIGAGVSHFGGNKPLSKLVMGVALLNFFIPGLNPGVKQIREAQLNPPPTEQSAGQEQVNPSPSPTPTPRATHRVVASGEVIVLDGDKAITIPEGRKSLCFSYLGIPGDKMVNQEVKIGEEIFSEMGTVCEDISHLSGGFSVVLFPDDNWSSQQIRDFYAYWRDQPGGQGEFPIIRIGE